MNKRLTSILDIAADMYPLKVACQFESSTITYKELRASAESISVIIKRKLSQGGNSRIALFLDLGINQVVAIWSVLYADGIYVPINLEYPEDRINYILCDSDPSLILVSNQTIRKVPKQFRDRVLNVDSLDNEPSFNVKTVLDETNTDEDIAYIIYTSGTTGNPKGVMVSHSNVYSLLVSTAKLFKFTTRDVWSMLHSYAFDFSVWEIFGAVYNKATLLMIPQNARLMYELFWKYITKHKVTILSQTPTFFNQVIPFACEYKPSKTHLRYVIFGGEKLNFQLLQRWTDVYPISTTKLVNMYGITETTVHSTFYDIQQRDLHQDKSIIGTELPGWRVVLKDANGEEITQNGVEGEICVYGEGVSQGYLNLKDLTKEKFPLDLNGSTFYRSGDIGYKDSYGQLVYVGRKDRQVKIRGYRIEAEEIEKAILLVDGVKSTAVFPYEYAAEDIRLIAFYTSKSDFPIDTNKIRESIALRLPTYMHPHKYINIETFPLTPNGKIDIQDLLTTYICNDKYASINSPEQSLEDIITSCCCEVLGVEDLIPSSNFFDLGANSIVLNILASKLNKVLIDNNIDVSISILDLYRHTSVYSLCHAIELKINDKQNETY